MARKWEKSDLISYLYGEIDPESKAELEVALNEDSGLQKDFNEIKETRDIMGRLGDKEVIPPQILFEGKESAISKLKPYRTWMAVAASILFVFLVGYLTDASIKVSGNELTLAWGNEDSSERLLTREEMDQMINEKVKELQAGSNQDLERRFENFKDEVDVRLVDLRNQNNKEIIRMVNNETSSQREELNLLVQNLKDQNLKSIAEFIEVNNKAQEQNVQRLLADFSSFINRQRVEDLTIIDQNLRTLRDNSESKFEEAGVLLASIINSVNSTRNE
jgi:hypothetical protein